jgi:hypothetical protein
MKKLLLALCLVAAISARADFTPPAPTPSSGGTPAGASGDHQKNSAGAFGAFTPGSGVETFEVTPTSANFKAAITDENAPDGATSKVIFALGSLSISTGKTLGSTNTLTLTGTDGSTLNVGTGGTLGTSAYITLGTGVGTSLAVANNSAGGYSPIDGAATETNKTFNSSTNTISDANTYTHDLTAIPNDSGGWTEYYVTSSDFTTTSTSLVDITGLVTGTLSVSTKYEFEFNLDVTHDTDAAGIKMAVHGAGTGSPTVFSVFTVNGGGTTTGSSVAVNAVDTATAALLNYANSHGVVTGRGFFTSGTGTPTMSLQTLAVTAGTVTVKKGSILRIKKAHI